LTATTKERAFKRPFENKAFLLDSIFARLCLSRDAAALAAQRTGNTKHEIVQNMHFLERWVEDEEKV